MLDLIFFALDVSDFNLPAVFFLWPTWLCWLVFSSAAAKGFADRRVNVITSDNPWTEPPADVLQIGMAYAARFLKDLEEYGRTSSSRLKVVLVGLANAGKTSVAVRLEGRAWSESLPTAQERTVGVEIRDIQLGPGPANNETGRNAHLEVKLWDFAGQKAYYDTHQVKKVRSRTLRLARFATEFGVLQPTKDAVLRTSCYQ